MEILEHGSPEHQRKVDELEKRVPWDEYDLDNKLLNAIDGAEEFLDENRKFLEPMGNPFEGYEKTPSRTVLRLDFELAGQIDIENAKKLMVLQLKNDISDLLVNGDTDNTADPLYKTLDGLNKLGRDKFDSVDIGQAKMLVNYIERKNSTEYHLWFELIVE